MSIIISSNGTEYVILENPHNWDLNELFMGRDVDFLSGKNIPSNNRTSEGLIPVNIGCDLKIKDRESILYTDNKPNSGIVTLKISSWIGISGGAMHYYGRLKFDTPDTHPEGEPNTWTSCWISLFDCGDIKLTHKLEEWEFKKYPESYEYYNIGDNYPGFYTVEEVIERGKTVFNELFEKKWKLKIEKI